MDIEQYNDRVHFDIVVGCYFVSTVERLSQMQGLWEETDVQHFSDVAMLNSLFQDEGQEQYQHQTQITSQSSIFKSSHSINHPKKEQELQMNKKSQMMPTLEDIEYTISKVKRFLPDHRVIFVIQYFFKQWLKGQIQRSTNQKKSTEQQLKTSSHQQLNNIHHNNDNNIYQSTINPSSSHFHSQNGQPSTSTNNNNTQLYDGLANDNLSITKLSNTGRAKAFTIKQKQSAAKSFISSRHQWKAQGEDHSKMMQSAIQSTISQQLMRLVLMQGYRSVEGCLQQKFNHKITRLSWLELSMLHTFFMDSWKWQPQLLSTFIKFIKHATHLEEIIVSEYETFNLYKTIISKMYELTNNHKFMVNVALNTFQSQNRRVIYKLQKQQNFNHMIEERTIHDRMEFIDLYVRYASLTQVKRELTKKYGINAQKSFMQYSKQMLLMLIRTALAKIVEMRRLKDKEVDRQWQGQLMNVWLNQISNNRYGRELRIKLLKWVRDGDTCLIDNILTDISNFKELNKKGKPLTRQE